MNNFIPSATMPAATHEALNLQTINPKAVAEEIALWAQIYYDNEVRRNTLDMAMLNFLLDIDISTQLRPFGYLNPFAKCKQGCIRYQHDPLSQKIRRKIRKHIKVYDSAGNNILAKKGDAHV